MPKQPGPRAQLTALRRELRFTQMMNRVDAGILRAGIRKAKRIGAEMRAIRKQIARRRIVQ